VQLDIEPSIGCTADEASDEGSIRRYFARMNVTLPDDIDLDICEYTDGGFLVTVWEQPNLTA
jgi:hypothetical protein